MPHAPTTMIKIATRLRRNRVPFPLCVASQALRSVLEWVFHLSGLTGRPHLHYSSLVLVVLHSLSRMLTYHYQVLSKF
jgi:hypothetical protein